MYYVHEIVECEPFKPTIHVFICFSVNKTIHFVEYLFSYILFQ